MIVSLGAIAEGLTLAQAADRVQGAVEYGKLLTQQAPVGHALFKAVADAEAVRDELRDMIPWFETQGPMVFPNTRTWSSMQGAIDGIYAASGTLTSDDPLKPTLWPTNKPLPWGWMTAGAAGLLGVAMLLKRKAA